MPLTYPEDLVSLDQVKQHLRATGTTAEDDLLALYIVQATAIVLNYIDREDDDWKAEIEAWTDSDVPPAVQAAILMQIGEMWRYRGDQEPPHREHGFLAPQIISVLFPYRDPSVA